MALRSSDPNKIMADLRGSLERIVNSLMADINNNVKATTPVRTGRARRGWHLTRFRLGGSASVGNNVPYITRLDEGYSRQAPRGIVAPVLSRLSRRKY